MLQHYEYTYEYYKKRASSTLKEIELIMSYQLAKTTGFCHVLTKSVQSVLLRIPSFSSLVELIAYCLVPRAHGSYDSSHIRVQFKSEHVNVIFDGPSKIFVNKVASRVLYRFVTDSQLAPCTCDRRACSLIALPCLYSNS